ncbi:MAG: hypothetical protein ACNA7O_10175 [Rhodobacterales bacterium]
MTTRSCSRKTEVATRLASTATYASTDSHILQLGNANDISLTQSGQSNSMNLMQDGAGNYLRAAQQHGSSNIVSLYVTGNSNGQTVLTAAGRLLNPALICAGRSSCGGVTAPVPASRATAVCRSCQPR